MSEVNVRIMVERPDKYNPGKFKVLFRQSLTYDSSVAIPFTELYRGLRLLFPHDDAIVHFYV